MSDYDRVHTTLTVEAGCRPLRVAYLLDPDTTAIGVVDAIVEHAITRWGGRYRTLVPLIDGTIPADWWPVLEAMDPDVIVFLQPLTERLVEQLTRRVLPFGIYQASAAAPIVAGGPWRFSDPTHGVDVLGHLRALASATHPHRTPLFLNLHATSNTNPDQAFILRNFGFFSQFAAAQGVLAHVPHEDIACDGLLPAAVLRRLAPHAYGAMTPAALAGAGCSGPSIPFAHDDALSDLHIVVGTTVRDAMYAWNRVLHTGVKLPPATLWLPASALMEDETVHALGFWLSRNGHKEEDSVCIASYEHAANDLALLTSSLQTKLRLLARSRTLASTEFPFPRFEGAVRDSHSFGDLPWTTRRTIEHVNLADGTGSMAIPGPPLLDEQYNQMEWMVDFAIPHRPEQYAHTNVRPLWRLPKRRDFGPSFFPNSRNARITATGLPSVVATGGRTQLRVPSDRELFHRCFQPRQHIHGKSRDAQPILSDFTASDVGRRLRGLIDVFGSFYASRRVFEDPFWRDTLTFMAGVRQAVSNDRRDRLEASLRAFLADYPEGIAAESPLLAPLANELSRALVAVEERRSRLTMRELKRRFDEQRKACLDVAAGNYWRAHTSFDDSFAEHTLEILLQRGVLHHGIEARCPHCGILHWFRVRSLGSVMTCPGCATAFHLPTDPIWCYRLNDLVANALRTSGCLAVLHALAVVGNHDFGREPFIFLPPQNVFRAGDNAPFTDIDLVCLAEGSLVIGEVKSTAAGFRVHDLEKLEQVALAVCPDKLLIAAPPGPFRDDVNARLAELTERCVACGVLVERLDLRWPYSN